MKGLEHGWMLLCGWSPSSPERREDDLMPSPEAEPPTVLARNKFRKLLSPGRRGGLQRSSSDRTGLMGRSAGADKRRGRKRTSPDKSRQRAATDNEISGEPSADKQERKTGSFCVALNMFSSSACSVLVK